MPIITVQMWSGRTEETKRELVKAVTDAVVNILDTSPEAVSVLINELPKENWGTGGELSSDRF